MKDPHPNFAQSYKRSLLSDAIRIVAFPFLLVAAVFVCLGMSIWNHLSGKYR